MGDAKDEDAAEKGEGAQAHMFRGGILMKDGADQPPDHLDHRPHEALIDPCEGFCRLHLLADQEARPGFGLLADE